MYNIVVLTAPSRSLVDRPRFISESGIKTSHNKTEGSVVHGATTAHRYSKYTCIMLVSNIYYSTVTTAHRYSKYTCIMIVSNTVSTNLQQLLPCLT